MSKTSVVRYDWDEAIGHLELLGYRGMGITRIAVSRTEPFEPGFIGTFAPERYADAIAAAKEIQPAHRTLGTFVGPNPFDRQAVDSPAPPWLLPGGIAS